MALNPGISSDKNIHIFDKQAAQLLIVLFLFIVAVAIRLYNIHQPPMDFSSIRQYQNAHIARGLYYETTNTISEEKKHIARINMERMGFVLEPRIIENAAVLGYRLAGAEHLWIPRVLSLVFWTIGAIFLYLTARILFPFDVALFCTVFYLFLPYSILSSRIFQPDPLMVMMMLCSIYGILKYDDKPSLSNLLAVAIVASVAVLVKPYCVFIIFGAFFSLVVFRAGLWKAVFNWRTLLFGFLIIFPSIVYYGYAILTNTGFLGEHAKGSFLPVLLISPSFWSGWLYMIGKVVGYIVFFLAIIGLIKTESGRAKALLLGLWTGYFLFGLSATYQIHTHSYYHMPFIPIIALSMAPIGEAVIKYMMTLVSRRLYLFVSSLVVLVIVLGLGLSIRMLPLKDTLSNYKSELKIAANFIGVDTEFPKFLSNDFEKEVKIAKEIGDHVTHSDNTVFLDADFGRVITYYGEFAGLPWPTNQSLYGRELRGAKLPNIKEDFTLKHIVLLYQGRFITYTPDYFIVTAFDEFNRQADLKDFLNANFPLLARSDDYLIFDLRKMSE